jgi:hypothetical protein
LPARTPEDIDARDKRGHEDAHLALD